MNAASPSTPQPRITRRWLVLIALLALPSWLACGRAPEPVALGAPAPDFELAALGGGRVDSRSLAGRPVVLNFWATWCQPCRKELPELQSLASESELQVVGIALDEDGAASVAPFVERLGIDYLVLLGDQATFQRFNGYTIPYTLLLGADREVLGIYRGPTTREAIERDLGAALRRATLEATPSEARPQHHGEEVGG